jgi:MoxR-like ATPase
MLEVRAVAEALLDAIERVVYGKRPILRHVMAALFGGGHVLLEDVPGVGKTTLAKALAQVIGGQFKRLQFTPDLLPADVTGVTLYDPHNGEFRFRPGPIFANIVLADEINRASPKTQSALLECMEEQTVTVDGVVHPVPRPFLVIATQNPIEHEGVYPLPESQLDRFMLRLKLGYPGREHERALLLRSPTEDPLTDLPQMIDPATVVECQRQVGEVHMEVSVQDYLLDLVAETRRDRTVRLGASPRAAMDLAAAARALALVDGRDYVRPDDLQELGPAVLGHRLLVDATVRSNGSGGDDVVRELLGKVPVP